MIVTTFIFTNFFEKYLAYLPFYLFICIISKKLFPLSFLAFFFFIFLNISSIFMDEVLSLGGKVLGSHPELEIKPIMLSPAPPDLSDQWNFTFECFKSSETNPIRAVECTPPLQSNVEQERQKSWLLSVHSNQISHESPQLNTGNLKFSASLQFPNHRLQFPSVFMLELPLIASQASSRSPGSIFCVKCSHCLRWSWSGPCCSGSGKVVLPWKTFLLQALIPTALWKLGPVPSIISVPLIMAFLASKLISLGKVNLTRLNGEPCSDWLLKRISSWLSHQLQHKSDLLGVTNDLSPEGLSQISNNSKQHLSKSSYSSAEPTAVLLFPLNSLPS